MPLVTSAAPASSHSGENPKARIDPSSTTFPPALRTASFFGEASNSSATASALPLDAADELDRDPQEVLRRRLVEARLPDEPREDELGGLVDRPAERRRDRAKDPLGNRDEVLGDAAHALALGGLRTDRDPAERGEAGQPERRRVGILGLGTPIATPPPSGCTSTRPASPAARGSRCRRTASRPRGARRARAALRADRRRCRRTTRTSSRRGTPARGSPARSRRGSRRARPRRSRRRRATGTRASGALPTRTSPPRNRA